MTAKSALMDVKYWDGEGADAHVIRTTGLRVVLFYTPDGHPTMYVDRPASHAPTEGDEYEDDLMMRWNRKVLDGIRSAHPAPEEGLPTP